MDKISAVADMVVKSVCFITINYNNIQKYKNSIERI